MFFRPIAGLRPLARFAALFFTGTLWAQNTVAPHSEPALVAHTLSYASGQSETGQARRKQTVTLSLPPAFDIEIAASGLRRVRFFAQAPDGRIFATGLYNLADNTRGSIFILDGWDATTHRFTHVVRYLDHLRNPNNLAFWTDPVTHQCWLYVPLTDRLLRFRYHPGDTAPTGPPETLIHFPDYGLNYKYGGWHLTRTVAVATLHGSTRVYVSAGSSCNYCQEHEVLRASVVSMRPDGSDQKVVAHGLRNAVDLRFVPDLDGGALFASNMGDDHLGDTLPEDTFFELDANDHPGPVSNDVQPPNYGWPTCYFAGGKPVHDTTPLPVLAALGKTAEAERPAGAGPANRQGDASADSVYGKQRGMTAAGVNLPAGGSSSAADPNASLGAAPLPLSRCDHVPAAYTTFAAHSSPLGFLYFGPENSLLRNSFLVALHGAGHPRIGSGYRVARFSPGDRQPQVFLSGFLTDSGGQPRVNGRPCGLLRVGPDSFLLTDDDLGLVYYIHPHGSAAQPAEVPAVH